MSVARKVHDKSLSDELDALAARLAKEPPCALQNTSTSPRDVPASCLTRERTRPLSPGEKRRGLRARPYDQYDDGALCTACSAYWHVTVALSRVMKLGK